MHTEGTAEFNMDCTSYRKTKLLLKAYADKYKSLSQTMGYLRSANTFGLYNQFITHQDSMIFFFLLNHIYQFIAFPNSYKTCKNRMTISRLMISNLFK